MFILLISENGTRVRHNLSEDAAKTLYGDLVLKGKVKVFSIDGDTVQQLEDTLGDDNETEDVEWVEVRHEHA